MATAKKLPSGNYRVRVYDKATGKYRSFTAETKREAERAAAEWLSGVRSVKSAGRLTVGEAVFQYIQSKEGVLSPSSIRGYNIILNNAIDEIRDFEIRKLDEKTLQRWVSNNARHYSPKSVKSQFGLVTAALRQNKIALDYGSVLLPRLNKYIPEIPTEEQIAKILHLVEGTSIELAVTMAITLGMRQSEIAGIKWSDYDGQFLYIHSAKVPNKDNRYEYKESTKSEASTRVLQVDSLLKERLDRAPRKSEFISPMLPSSVLRKFQQICENNGLPKFTMHAQRHGNASLMLAQNIPDKYAMQRLGQSSNNMIKNIYQHLYSDKQKDVSDKVSDQFQKIYDTKYDTSDDES